MSQAPSAPSSNGFIKEPLRTILLWAIAGLLFVGAAVGFTYVPSKHDIGVNYHEVQQGLDHPDKR
ncbi:MAG TPA: hypothetical protein VIM58_13100 [Candidatus Methylacidiphilales bacterium]